MLLDEPLANLDYKLREELREELPRIFAESGAIFVYATTEPSEALLLGGNTATLNEGRVTQFSRTIEVYRRPVDIVTAEIFADPPLNTIEVIKTGGAFTRANQAVVTVPAHLAAVPDGPLTIAFQPHHLFPHAKGEARQSIRARTLISEIAGSESFVHVEFSGRRWVMLAHGIHDIEPDRDIELFLDTKHLMAFDANGRAIGEAA
ncbi:putative ATP-binding protein of sugar ABC transporter [Agrobacterium tumefaciens]|nr:putative ATP-binding protein of sugar ABC transporter [Agrobacterium tumefaciens]